MYSALIWSIRNVAAPALLAAAMCGQTFAQTAGTIPAPIVNEAALDRLTAKPPVGLTAKGKPRTQSTWCRATGPQPASKWVKGGTVSYGKGMRLSNQIGACSARPPGL